MSVSPDYHFVLLHFTKLWSDIGDSILPCLFICLAFSLCLCVCVCVCTLERFLLHSLKWLVTDLAQTQLIVLSISSHRSPLNNPDHIEVHQECSSSQNEAVYVWVGSATCKAGYCSHLLSADNMTVVVDDRLCSSSNCSDIVETCLFIVSLSADCMATVSWWGTMCAGPAHTLATPLHCSCSAVWCWSNMTGHITCEQTQGEHYTCGVPVKPHLLHMYLWGSSHQRSSCCTTATMMKYSWAELEQSAMRCRMTPQI